MSFKEYIIDFKVLIYYEDRFLRKEFINYLVKKILIVSNLFY